MRVYKTADGVKKMFSSFDLPRYLYLLDNGYKKEEEEILVAFPFSEFQKNCVPFVKYKDRFYSAGGISPIPDDLVGKILTAREYEFIEKLPEDIEEDSIYVYKI